MRDHAAAPGTPGADWSGVWAGLRGAASVVFVLFTVVSGVPGSRDLFTGIMVAIISIVMQGSLLPPWQTSKDD